MTRTRAVECKCPDEVSFFSYCIQGNNHAVSMPLAKLISASHSQKYVKVAEKCSCFIDRTRKVVGTHFTLRLRQSYFIPFSDLSKYAIAATCDGTQNKL